MKLTDVFLRRPVLAVVVSVLIVVAGLQAVRNLNVRQYPRIESATISVKTVYVGASADLVRGFITTPLERSIAAADGIDYIESQSVQGLSTINVRLKLNFNAAAALADISARVDQVRADLPPEARDSGDHNRAVGRPVRGDVPELRVGRAAGQPGHRLPDPRRAAAAVGDRRRAARGDPGRADVRAARLAEAGSDGGAQRQRRRRCARRWPPTTTSPPSVRPRGRWCRCNDHRLDRPALGRRVQEAGDARAERGAGPAGGRRGRRAGRRRLRPGRALLRREGGVHGRVGAAQRQLARRDQPRQRRDRADPATSCRAA